MAAAKATSIVYIDVWNYWHFACMGALVQATGGRLLPACGQLMGAVSTALRSAVQRRFPGRALAISMDTGVIMTGLVLMPLSIVLAFILPGKMIIPLGDLPNLISIMSLLTLAVGGNVFRAVLAGLPVVAAFLLVSSGPSSRGSRRAIGSRSRSSPSSASCSGSRAGKAEGSHPDLNNRSLPGKASRQIKSPRA